MMNYIVSEVVFQVLCSENTFDSAYTDLIQHLLLERCLFTLND